VLYLKPIGLLYDFIMIDECQDLNKAERELVLKCFKMGTRLVAVGDENQSIYSFSGADPESFNILKSLPNTECLPLSISYRCPKNVVEFAQKLVPSIEYNENNKNLGEVKYNVPLSDIEDGDMILCRNNAPLIQVYNEFLKLGKKAFIRGKDIGTNLKTLVKSVRQEKINADCREDGLFVRLYDDLFVTRNNIMERSAIDAKTAMTSPIIENKLDMIKALEILSEGLNTTDELIAKIDDIFPKRDKKDGISLSTIHKAKGLEANNVYIACNSLMPSSSAKKDWEILQEHNLIYVAYTRAKNILGFIDEKDFKDFDLKNTSSQAKLDRIETQVNRILGKTTKIIINENTAKVIIDNAQKIDLKEIKPARNITNINSKRTINSFSDLFMNKKQMKIKR
jgi:superfamily I DNA/RNA helicase